jgi:chaperone required for assembly of F1-ATPase
MSSTRSGGKGGDRRSDWFRDTTEPNPMRAAQKALRRDLPRRFYQHAQAVRRGGGFAVALDGRAVRTPAKALLTVSSEALAEAMAAEWNNQTIVIDPASMPITRIVNSAIDGVARESASVAAEIVKYAGSDMLAYRVDDPERLVRRQREAWDPVLDWAEEALGARLTLATGILFVPQPDEALDALAKAVKSLDPLRLAALHVITTLTGSAVLALAVARGRLEPEAAWAAAHVDEDFQAELWGVDEEARARRSFRWHEMEAAARILALTTE